MKIVVSNKEFKDPYKEAERLEKYFKKRGFKVIRLKGRETYSAKEGFVVEVVLKVFPRKWDKLLPHERKKQ
jgi:uncharacterized Fe-S cluster-containing radical SAM superfamily protein